METPNYRGYVLDGTRATENVSLTTSSAWMNLHQHGVRGPKVSRKAYIAIIYMAEWDVI